MSVNHLTAGRIPRGALLQAVPRAPEMQTDALQLLLHEPDFASASLSATFGPQETPLQRHWTETELFQPPLVL